MMNNQTIANSQSPQEIYLNNLLKKVGARTFVEYFPKLKNDIEIQPMDLARNHSSVQDYTDNSINTKANVAKRIFREGLALEALRLIAEKIRVGADTRFAAQNYLNGE